MVKIIKAKPQKQGNSHYFHIPSRYIKDKNICVEKEYDLDVDES